MRYPERVEIDISPCLQDGAGRTHSYRAKLTVEIELVSLSDIRKFEDHIMRYFEPTETLNRDYGYDG